MKVAARRGIFRSSLGQCFNQAELDQVYACRMSQEVLRRKEKEQVVSTQISGLEAQLREMTAEKEHYQRERDFWQDVVLQHRIPIPPRPLSPRRRKHTSLSKPRITDTETAQIGDKNTL